jgi:hypothetical protein
VISRWLSSALPPEFSDEKLFLATHGQDSRRLLIVQDITKSVEMLKEKVDKWRRKSMAERAATAKSSEEFARLVFEDIQRNVTALVNIEESYRVHSAGARAMPFALSLALESASSAALDLRCRPCTNRINGGVSTPKRRASGSSSTQRGRLACARTALSFAPDFCLCARAGFV